MSISPADIAKTMIHAFAVVRKLKSLTATINLSTGCIASRAMKTITAPMASSRKNHTIGSCPRLYDGGRLTNDASSVDPRRAKFVAETPPPP